MKKIALLALLMGCMIIPSLAQKQVYQLPLDSGHYVKGQTFSYMLPTTAFKVEVTLTKVRELKGHYADQAQDLLGLQNVITENRTHYEVSAVEIEPVRMPDPNHAYLVQLSKNQIEDDALSKLISKKNLVSKLPEDVQKYEPESKSIPEFFRNYSDLSYTEEEASFVETKIIDGVVTQVPANKSKTVQLTASQKAKEAADNIAKSRQNQFLLMTGEHETPYSKDALKLMIKELKKWEQNYLSLFSGLVLEDELTYTFYVTPAEGQTQVPLFACDADKGFSRETNLNANVYTLVLNPVYNTSELRLLTDIPVKNSKKTPNGYRIRKTVPVQASLSLKNQSIFDFGTFNMSQFGLIQTLPTNQDKFEIQKFGFIY